MSLSKIKYNTKCGVCSGDDWHDCDCGNDLFSAYQSLHNSQDEPSFHTLQRVPTQHNVPVETSPHISQVETSSHTSHETRSQSEQVNDIWNTYGDGDSIFSAYQTHPSQAIPSENNDGKYAFIFIHSCLSICYFIFHSCILTHSFTCSMYNLQRTKLAR